ncbi:MAG: DUF1207 domain-containing protein, partial [Nitrospinota bacterium]
MISFVWTKSFNDFASFFRGLFFAIAFTLIPATHLMAAEETDSQSEHVIFPLGDLFDTLIADPNQPQVFINVHNYDAEQREDTRVSTAGFGGSFGLIRWPGVNEADGWQVSFVGGVFAQFDLDENSMDLLNADYVVGVDTAYRHGRNSMRIRLFHQSTHLGDALLRKNSQLLKNT